MNLTLTEVTAYLTVCSVVVGALFAGIKYIYERLDLGKNRKQTVTEKAYEAVWKLYEATKKEKEELEKEIAELKKGDSLARPTVNKIYQAVRKLAREIEIIDALLIRDFSETDLDECRKVIDTLKKEVEILWQKFDELEKTLP